MSPLKTPSDRKSGWEAFTHKYVSELKVRLLHSLHRVMRVLLLFN
jgi:hypothetical protein